MKAPRIKKLSWWLAGIYLVYSGLVYFGTLGGDAHSWWPVFIYPLIWPWSWIEHSLIEPLLSGWLAPDPRTTPESAWLIMDIVAGGYYIVIGTLWFWTIGQVISRIDSWLFPRRG